MPIKAIELTDIPSVYLPPSVEQPPLGSFASLEALNRKVTEVSDIINIESREIESREVIIKQKNKELTGILEEETTWTNTIIDWVSHHTVADFVFSGLTVFNEAKSKINELKDKRNSNQSTIDLKTKEKEQLINSRQDLTNYKSLLEDEVAKKMKKIREDELRTSSNQAVFELFNTLTIDENHRIPNGELQYNHLPILKNVTDIHQIKPEDVTSPIMRFDNGFVIKYGITVVPEFGESPQMQVFYTKKNEDAGNWYAWAPKDNEKHIKVENDIEPWIKAGDLRGGKGPEVADLIKKIFTDEKKFTKEDDLWKYVDKDDL